MSKTRMTDGAAIHIKWVGRLVLRDVVADGQNGNGSLWNGFWFGQIDMVRLDGFEARAQNDAIRVSAEGAGNPGVQSDPLKSNPGRIPHPGPRLPPFSAARQFPHPSANSIQTEPKSQPNLTPIMAFW